MAHSPVAGSGHDSALPRPTVTVTLERVDPREDKSAMGSAHGSGRLTPPLEGDDGKGSDGKDSQPNSPRNLPANPPRSQNLNLSATNPNLETGVFVTIGKSRFYFRHLKNGEEMAHTKEEWNQLIGSRIKTCLTALPQDEGNAGFNIEQHKRLEIDLSARTVKCTPQAEDLPAETYKIGRKAQSFFQALTTTLQARPGISMQHPAARGTIVPASCSQTTSPLGEIAKHACTAIAAEFIQTALFARDGNFLKKEILDGCISRGQQNYLGKITPLVTAAEERGADSWDSNANPNYEFRNLDDGIFTDCYALLMWADQDMQRNIPARNANGFYEKLIKDLVEHEDLVRDETVAAGITNGRGESYSIVIYRDSDDPSKIKEIVYFDSHSHARENGTPNACAIRFKATEQDPDKAARDAAAFLAQRTPYEESQVATWNSLSITPFCRHESWSRLFKAQASYFLASGDDDNGALTRATAEVRDAVVEFLDADNNEYMKASVALAVTQKTRAGTTATAEARQAAIDAGKIAMRDDPNCLNDPHLQMSALENFQAAIATDKRRIKLPLPLKRVEELPSDDEQD
jgi:hypothetical protein